MMSSNVLIFLLFLLLITLAESEKKSVDKIIIHVPYKVHKHHHTHTKYKVITIPAPKHESTIIYFKENQQKTKLDAHPQESNFPPPHQQSAATLLQHLQDYNKETEPEHLTGQSAIDQKSLESSNQNFISNYEYQPMIIPTHENIIPQFLLKPVVLPQQMLNTKLITNPTFHHQNNFIPYLEYQTIFQPPPQPFIPKLTMRQNPLSKIPQDNVAYATSHDYKTVVTRRPKSETYKVKEEVQEDEKSPFHKNPYKIPTKPRVPSDAGKGKTYVNSGLKYNIKNIAKIIPTDPNYEYEHIGYLIIDGKSRKIVGKNFKDEIHLTR